MVKTGRAFDWCVNDDHANCISRSRRFFVDTKTNKPVWLDEWVDCGCTKRGCKCNKSDEKPVKKAVRRKK